MKEQGTMYELIDTPVILRGGGRLAGTELDLHRDADGKWSDTLRVLRDNGGHGATSTPEDLPPE